MGEQFTFINGHWVDQWNNVRDDEQHPDRELEWQEAILFDGFCGCGNPEMVLDAMVKFLSLRRDNFTYLDGSLEQLMLAYWADHRGLTDHGGSVYGAWITDAGRRWLELH